MTTYSELVDYKKYIDLSWPQDTTTIGPFMDQVATVLNWPTSIYSAPGNPEDVLKKLGVKQDTYVILPNLCPTYWAAAAKALGADCILVDVDPKSWQLDLDMLEEFLMNYTHLNEQDQLILKKDSKAIKAILVPHLLGGMCDMDRLQFIARRFYLEIGEDITQALGSQWKDQTAGSFGTINYCHFALNPILPFGQAVVFSTDEKLISELTKNQNALTPMAALGNHLGQQLVPKLTDIIAAFQTTEQQYRQTISLEHISWMQLPDSCQSNGLSAAFMSDKVDHSNGQFGRVERPLYLQSPFNKCLYIRRENWSGKIWEKGSVLPIKLDEVVDYEAILHEIDLLN